MSKKNIKDILYQKKGLTKHEIDIRTFDNLQGPGVLNLITEVDAQRLYDIATSGRYSGNIEKKYKAMNAILEPRGFRVFHRGTNRVVYRFFDNKKILLKVGVDRAGCMDGLREIKNQEILKPFVTKVFDVHPSGISVNERVVPITSYRMFMMMAGFYYDMMSKVFIGKYVMEDVGEKYFMNWGIREGFGLVLLDYPYLFELDQRKLVCYNRDPKNPGVICGGEIDYDLGFNALICTKCGRRYYAKDLGKMIMERKISMFKAEDRKPITVRIVNGKGEVVATNNPNSKSIRPANDFKKSNKPKRHEVVKDYDPLNNPSKVRVKRTETHFDENGKQYDEVTFIDNIKEEHTHTESILENYKESNEYKNMNDEQKKIADELIPNIIIGNKSGGPFEIINQIVQDMQNRYKLTEDDIRNIKNQCATEMKHYDKKEHVHCNHDHDYKHERFGAVPPEDLDIQNPFKKDEDDGTAVNATFMPEENKEDTKPSNDGAVEAVFMLNRDLGTYDIYGDDVTDDEYREILGYCLQDIELFKRILRNHPNHKDSDEDVEAESTPEVEAIEEVNNSNLQQEEVYLEDPEEVEKEDDIDTEVIGGEEKMDKVEFDRMANAEADKYLGYYLNNEEDRSVLDFKNKMIELIQTLFDENKVDVPNILQDKTKEEYAEQFAEDYIKYSDVVNIIHDLGDYKATPKKHHKYNTSDMDEF